MEINTADIYFNKRKNRVSFNEFILPQWLLNANHIYANDFATASRTRWSYGYDSHI